MTGRPFDHPNERWHVGCGISVSPIMTGADIKNANSLKYILFFIFIYNFFIHF